MDSACSSLAGIARWPRLRVSAARIPGALFTRDDNGEDVQIANGRRVPGSSQRAEGTKCESRILRRPRRRPRIFNDPDAVARFTAELIAEHLVAVDQGGRLGVKKTASPPTRPSRPAPKVASKPASKPRKAKRPEVARIPASRLVGHRARRIRGHAIYAYCI